MFERRFGEMGLILIIGSERDGSCILLPKKRVECIYVRMYTYTYTYMYTQTVDMQQARSSNKIGRGVGRGREGDEHRIRMAGSRPCPSVISVHSCDTLFDDRAT